MNRFFKRSVLTDENRKNAGVSLVEIVIVCAIFAVLAGGLALSINAVKGADVTKATRNIESNYAKLRTHTMSQTGDWELVVYEKEDMYYSVVRRDGVDYGTVLELGEYVNISYKDDVGTVYSVDADNPLSISLRPSTGAVNRVNVGTAIVYDTSANSESSYGTIEITRKKKTSTLKFYYITGKVVK